MNQNIEDLIVSTTPYIFLISPELNIICTTGYIKNKFYYGITVYEVPKLTSIYDFNLNKLYGDDKGLDIIINNKDIIISKWDNLMESLKMEFGQDFELSCDNFKNILKDKRIWNIYDIKIYH